MISYNCNTLVAVSILSSRLKVGDVLQALNRNVPAIGGDGAEFKRHHLDQIWEHMRRHHNEWHTFALSLKHDNDPRIDRAVQRLRNGCLHEYMFQQDGGITMDTLMMTYESVVDPVRFRAGNMGIEIDDAEYD
jgi:hypothetical protein